MSLKQLKEQSTNKLVKEIARLRSKAGFYRKHRNPRYTIGAARWFSYHFCKTERQFAFIQGFDAAFEWSDHMSSIEKDDYYGHPSAQRVAALYEALKNQFNN